MKKKMLAAVLGATMILGVGLTGCGSGTADFDKIPVLGAIETQTPEEIATLMAKSSQKDSFIIDAGKLNLDPTYLYDSGTELYSIYEMLFQVAGGLGSDMVPTLADGSKGDPSTPGYSHVAGSSEYTIFIQDNIYDHAGNHFTASDAVFSFQKTVEGQCTSGWDVVNEWVATSDYVVTMKCKRELTNKGEFENIVLRCFMFTEKAYNDGKVGTTTACGTGPYKLKSYTSGSSCVVEKYADYWAVNSKNRQRGQYANVNTITVRLIEDETSRYLNVTGGDTDMSQNVPANYLAQTENSGLTVAALPGNDLAYLEANMSGNSPVSNDLNLRLAIFYAISSADMAQYMGGEAYNSVACFGCTVFPDYNTDWESWKNYQTSDSAEGLEKAKEYLAASNYKGQELVIICATTTGPDFVEAVLEKYLNIQCKIKVSTTIDTDLVSGKSWDLYYNSGVRASDYLANMWSHVMNASAFSGGVTEGRYDSSEYQALLQKCLSENATQSDMNAFWQATLDNALVEGLYSPVTYVAYSSSVVTDVWLNDKSVFLPGAFIYA